MLVPAVVTGIITWYLFEGAAVDAHGGGVVEVVVVRVVSKYV